MPGSLQGAVVVITGASSGIGRAAATAFAEKGASVVLAARRAELLENVADECRGRGGDALAVVVDVTDAEAVEGLAEAAVERFGRIDVWVNNAGVTALGRFEKVPPDAFRRVIETNAFGYVHGARAALRVFREQGRGTLINNASIAGRTSQPFAAAYVMSKHAVRGLGMSLRQELSLEGASGIHVCTVLPATIDTPFFQHAGNYTGRAPKAMPPVYAAEGAARTIVHLAQVPRRETFVGGSGRMIALQQTLAPALAERMMARMVDRTHFYRDRTAAPTPGNLFEAGAYGSTDGGWGGTRKTRIRRGATAALALGGALTYLRSR